MTFGAAWVAAREPAPTPVPTPPAEPTEQLRLPAQLLAPAPQATPPEAPAPEVTPPPLPSPEGQAAPAPAPSGGERILGIKVVGYQTVSPDTIAHYLGIKIGDPYDRAKIQENF